MTNETEDRLCRVARYALALIEEKIEDTKFFADESKGDPALIRIQLGGYDKVRDEILTALNHSRIEREEERRAL